MSIEAAEQIANMLVMEPYPGFEGRFFFMPCRNVVPKPVQKPHPPMWMACTNRETIKVAASLGLGALAFSFVDAAEAQTWSKIYYDIIKSEQCVPLGYTVNPNIALVSAFSIHEDRAEAIRRGQEGFEFFAYALNVLVAQDTVPGRTQIWSDFQQKRGDPTDRLIAAAAEQNFTRAAGIGTPDDMRRHLQGLRDAGVDQIIFMQQAGRNRHGDICESLELFARTVMPEFKAETAARESRKAEELAPYIAAALARKTRMRPLAEHEIPVVKASVKKAQIAAA
jgi:alkanesulfonate monooxygenase SsuD/methylene tetrahydromethanopterin reductase-like flavin-dependent oxidoreductase (luciferase family)